MIELNLQQIHDRVTLDHEANVLWVKRDGRKSLMSGAHKEARGRIPSSHPGGANG